MEVLGYIREVVGRFRVGVRFGRWGLGVAFLGMVLWSAYASDYVRYVIVSLSNAQKCIIILRNSLRSSSLTFRKAENLCLSLYSLYLCSLYFLPAPPITQWVSLSIIVVKT